MAVDVTLILRALLLRREADPLQSLRVAAAVILFVMLHYDRLFDERFRFARLEDHLRIDRVFADDHLLVGAQLARFLAAEPAERHLADVVDDRCGAGRAQLLVLVAEMAREQDREHGRVHRVLVVFAVR